MSAPALLELEDVHVHFAARPAPVRAVDGVSLSLEAGETLALVGESGSGKSTLARAILGILPCDSGIVRFRGAPLPPLGDPARRPFLRQIQMIFQDPDASLDPRLTIASSIGEPLEIHERARGRAARKDRVEGLMTDVGLDPTLSGRYPHELSGGQRQRVCIARALATRPELLVCDEAVSALDVSIQAQILNLLADLRNRHGLSYLFITHDLRVVRYLSTRVAVMYLGQIVELGPTGTLFEAPAHPYTRALLSAVPSLSSAGARVPGRFVRGDIPSPSNPPAGCRFHPRCPEAFDRCPTEVPRLYPVPPGGHARCFLCDPEPGPPSPGRSAR